MPAIKNSLRFSLNFLRNPLRNASIVPSSAAATRAMLQGIDFSAVASVVELGPGTGVFTREIVKRCRPDTKLLLIELEESYVRILRREFGARVMIEQANAHRLDELLAKHDIQKVSLIVSGLPVSLPESMAEELLLSIKAHTTRGTIFRFFTYNPPFMRRAYKNLPVRKIALVLKNFPPLWVYGIN